MVANVVAKLDPARVLDAIATWNGTWWDGVGVGIVFGPPVLYILLAIPSVVLVAAGIWSLGDDRFGLRLPAGPRNTARLTTYLASILALAIVTPLVLIPQLHVPAVPARLPSSREELTSPGLATYANGIDLLDVKTSSELIRGGELPVTLHWRFAHSPPSNFVASVQLVGPSNHRLAGADAIPDESEFPPELWQAGEIVEDKRQLSVPAELVPGTYGLRAGLSYLDSADNRVTPISVRSDKPSDSIVSVGRWRVLPDATGRTTAIPSAAQFDGVIAQRGYITRLTPTSLHVQSFWVSIVPLDRRIVISVQVLDPMGRLIAQNDHEPVDGRIPTMTWSPGEIIRDDHDLPLSGGWSASNQVIVELYDRPTSRRLSLTSSGQLGADYLTLQSPTAP